MFGQSLFITTLTTNLTRRVTYMGCRAAGKSQAEAMDISDDVALAAGATVGSMAAIVTLDVPGAALSAGYIALEAGTKAAAERARS